MSDPVDQEAGDPWLTPWEKKCLEEWEKVNGEMTLEERLQAETDRSEQKVWQSFQNSASAISHLYKEGAQQNSIQLWVPFQSAAGAATILYKDSQDMMRRSFELGTQLGGHRRTREILAWTRKRRRHVAREDLIAFVCGRSAPPASSRPHHRTAQSTAYSRAAGRLSGLEPSSPRFVPLVGGRGNSYFVASDPPDLTAFKDALALQGLNGAMSNVSVGRRTSQMSHTNGSSHNSHNSPLRGSPHRGSPLNNAAASSDDLHGFVVEQFRRHSAMDSRKRAASTDGRGGSDSPTSGYKRNRMEMDDY